MKRVIRLVFKDGSTKDLELTKVTRINSDLGMLNIDKVKDGWRLIFSQDITDEFINIDRIDIVRED